MHCYLNLVLKLTGAQNRSIKILNRRYLRNRWTDSRKISDIGPDFCKEYLLTYVQNWSERFSPHFFNFFQLFLQFYIINFRESFFDLREISDSGPYLCKDHLRKYAPNDPSAFRPIFPTFYAILYYRRGNESKSAFCKKVSIWWDTKISRIFLQAQQNSGSYANSKLLKAKIDQ